MEGYGAHRNCSHETKYKTFFEFLNVSFKKLTVKTNAHTLSLYLNLILCVCVCACVRVCVCVQWCSHVSAKEKKILGKSRTFFAPCNHTVKGTLGKFGICGLNAGSHFLSSIYIVICFSVHTHTPTLIVLLPK